MRLRVDRGRQYPDRGRAVGQTEARGRCRERGVGQIDAVVIDCEEGKRRSNPFYPLIDLDCFAEPVIGRRVAPTRWLAMTEAASADLLWQFRGSSALLVHLQEKRPHSQGWADDGRTSAPPAAAHQPGPSPQCDEKRPDPEPDLRILSPCRHGGIDVRPPCCE